MTARRPASGAPRSSALHAPLRDIASDDDVAQLVRAFYDDVFADHLLGPVFEARGSLQRHEHLQVMQDFWMTVLFRANRYRRNALEPHRRLHAQVPLSSVHFARWLALWSHAVQERHAGPVADHAQVQARRIATSLQRRLSERPDVHELRSPVRAVPVQLERPETALASAGEPAAHDALRDAAPPGEDPP